MIIEYELYSDEREHRNADGKHLLLGGVICTDNGRTRLRDALSHVRNEYDLSREMRWSKVSNAYLEAYKAWMDVFFADPYARFSLLSANQSSPQWANFRPNSKGRPSRDQKLVSTFYQFLLISFGPLRDTKRWRVYPDAGFFSHDNVLERVEFLFNRTYKKAFGPRTSRIIRFARSRDSKLEDLIQLADLLLGASACNILGPMPTSQPKVSLIEHWRTQCKLIPRTRKGLQRFSQFEWTPPEEFAYHRT